MLWAAVPPAAIDEDGQLPPNEDDVRATTSAAAVNRDVNPVTAATPVKFAAERHLRAGV